MKLQIWANKERGRGLLLAKALGVQPPSVSDWITGKKRVPVERCAAIERVTGGEVTRRDLRPDDYLDIWPELAETQAKPAQAAIKTIADQVQFAIRHQEQAAEPEINPMATAPQAEDARELSRHA